MSEAVFLILCCALPGPLLGLTLRRWRPGWSPWRASALSAAVIPVVVIAFCLSVFVHAATSSAEACGVDACGMAMMAATYVSAFALLGFVTGWAASFSLLFLLARR